MRMSNWRRWDWSEAWEKAFKTYYPYMVEQINPTEMLPYLPCLSEADQQGIQCRQDNHGARDAVQMLKGCLLRKGNPQEFLDALRQIKFYDLAEILEHALDVACGGAPTTTQTVRGQGVTNFIDCNVQIGDNNRMMVNQSVDDSEVSSTEDSDAVADNATNDSTAITAINSERTAWSEMGPDINSHTVGPSEVRPDVVGSDSDVSCSTLALPPVSADTELKVLYDTPSEPTHLNTLPLGDRAIGSPVDAATKSIWEEGFVFSLMLSSEDEESSGEETVLTPCRYPRPDTQPANDDGDGKISHITEIYVSRRDVCGTTGDNKGCSVVCPVKDNGDSSDVNLVKDKDSSDVDIVQDKDSCDVDLVQDKDSSSVNLVQDKDSSDVNIIVQDKDSCDVNLVQDKDSSSVNIIVQDKDSSDVNIVQDKDSSDVNLVQEKYSSDVSLVQDKDSSDVNIVQDKDSSDVSLVQDKDSSDVNLVQDKDSSGDNFVQDKDSYGVNLVKDKDSSDVNLVQDKDSFGVNLVQDKDSSDDILVKDNDCSHVQDNNDGSDARMKKTEPNENRDDCNNTTRLLSVLVAAIVAVTGVVIFIKLQRV